MKPTEERSLPTDIDAERGVIAACISASDVSGLLEARSILTADDFSLSDHKRVYGLLCGLNDAGEKFGITELYHAMAKADLIETIGGISWLTDNFSEGGLYRLNLSQHLARVRDLSLRRRVINSAQVLIYEAANQTTPIEQSLALFESNSREAATPLKSEAETVGDIVDDAGGWDEFMGASQGLKSPWSEFNDVTGGYQDGDLIIIGARPSMGKTALMLESARASTRAGETTAIYSYEMTAGSLLKRMLSRETHIPFIQILTGETTKQERMALTKAKDELGRLPIHIVSSAGKTPLWVRCHAERLKRKKNLRIGYVDYLQLVPSSVRTSNRNNEVGGITREFKLLASEMKIPIVLLSQLNRANETRTDKRPGMSDLRDSGEIEAHADLIEFIHREEYYQRDREDLRGDAELILAKQRNGATPIIKLVFVHQYGAFLDPAPRYEENAA